MMSRPTCGNCPHYQHKLGGQDQGECHRAAPALLNVPTPQGLQSFGVWLPVGKTSLGCEHHPAKAAYVESFQPEPMPINVARNIDIRV